MKRSKRKLLALVAGLWILAWLCGSDPGYAADERLSGQIYSPNFSPSNPDIVAFERRAGDAWELYIYNRRSGDVQQLTAATGASPKAGSDVFEDLFREEEESANVTRFEGQLSWRPVLDSKGRQWFAFVSSGDEQSYDLYLSYIDTDGRLAADGLKHLTYDGVDQMPRWSPDGQSLVFVSGSGRGNDLYLVRNMSSLLKGTDVSLFQPVKITDNPGDDTHPVWSPDGRFIAFQEEKSDGEFLNTGVALINVQDVGPAGKVSAVRLSGDLGKYHEYQPSWSPDGRFIAFYVTQRPLDRAKGNRLQDIGVLAVIKDASSGRIAGGRVLRGTSLRLADNVVPNRSGGPAWIPQRKGEPGFLYITYVKREEEKDNPIYTADFSRWQQKNLKYKSELSSRFDTRLHRDVAITLQSSGTRLAFVSHAGHANKLQVEDLSGQKKYGLKVRMERERNTALLRSLLVPGLGQRYKGQKTKGTVLTATAILSAAGYLVFNGQTALDDYNQARRNYLDVRGDNADDYSEAFKTWQQEADDVNSAISKTKTFLFLTLGVWAYNAVDSFMGFPLTVEQPMAAMRDAGRLALAPEVGWTAADGRPVYWLKTRIEF